MSATDAKSGEYATPVSQQQVVGQTPTILASGNCSYCETMYKNLQYLENYLRSNTAKNSCNSCATCLSFLLYMKQQGLPIPRFDTSAVSYGAGQTINMQGGAQTYTVQETVTYQAANTTQDEGKAAVPKKPRLKSSSVQSRSKLVSKSLSSSSSPTKSSKSQPLVSSRHRLGATTKKLRKTTAHKGSAPDITPNSSAAKMKQTASDSSGASSASNSRKLTKLGATKSTLAKTTGSKVLTKRKVKTRVARKKVKTAI